MADTISAVKDTVEDVGAAVQEQAQDIGAKAKRAVPPYGAKRMEARIYEYTPEEINQQIRRDLKARVLYFAQRPEEIDRRLDELDREWGIERRLEAGAGILSLVGLTFGVLRSRWYILSAAAAAFLVQHAVQGGAPPVSMMRRLGVRTAREINHERYALKALRGDFDSVHLGADLDAEERARRAIDAADANT
jgi:Flp pilus assembly protein TadB